MSESSAAITLRISRVPGDLRGKLYDPLGSKHIVVSEVLARSLFTDGKNGLDRSAYKRAVVRAPSAVPESTEA